MSASLFKKLNSNFYMSSTWTAAIGYEGIYEVSSDGEVRNMFGKVLKPWLSSRGYPALKLWKNKKYFHCYVHTLVIESFVGIRPEGLEVNHINGIKSDNRVSNLEWISSSENHKHAYNIGIHVAPHGSRHYRSKLNEKKVREIRKSDESCKSLAVKFKVSACTISQVKTGKSWVGV